MNSEYEKTIAKESFKVLLATYIGILKDTDNGGMHKYSSIKDALDILVRSNAYGCNFPSTDRITNVWVGFTEQRRIMEISFSPRWYDLLGWVFRGKSKHILHYCEEVEIPFKPLKYSPLLGTEVPDGYNLSPDEFRSTYPEAIWLWNPDTLRRRPVAEILADPFGKESWGQLAELKHMNKVLKDNVAIMKQLVETATKKE